jgi:hypothetical protein
LRPQPLRFRRAALLIGAAVGAALLPTAGALAQGWPIDESVKRCRPTAAKTVARTATVLVVKRRDGAVQACYLPTRRVTVISTDDTPIGNYLVSTQVWEARGRYVAHHAFEEYQSEVDVWIRVLDARTGRLVVNFWEYSGTYGPEESTPPASDHALLANGTLAWIAAARPVSSGVREVRYARPRDKTLTPLVASGTTIEPGSLALNNRYVYWSQDGAPRGLRLKPMP